MKIFVRKNNATLGPYRKEEFEELQKKGAINKSDLICLDGKNWIQMKDSGLVQSGALKKLGWKLGVVIICFSILMTLIFYFADLGGFSGWQEGSESRDLDYFNWGEEENDSFKNGATVLVSRSGEVQVRDAGEKELAEAKDGQVLSPGARIETGKEGEAVVLFSNGTSVAVGKKTNFSVNMFGQKDFNASDDVLGSVKGETSASQIKLDLKLGELVVVVKKLDRESSIIVSSKLGFAGVRGTSFSLKAEEDSCLVNVLSGEVDFLDTRKRSKFVRANERAWSDGKELVLERKISPKDRERIEAMEAKAKEAIKGVPISSLREYFDLVNPSLGMCDPEEKNKRFLAAGGNAEITNSINRGLNWLISMQQEDGSWGAGDKDESGNNIKLDLWHKKSMTAQAVLCLLGNCELDPDTVQGKALEKGIQFLQTNLSANVGGGNRGSYGHPMQTRALVLGYKLLKRPELESVAFKAVATVIDGQNENGGWAYAYGKGPVAHVDLSVTGWNVMALAEAQLAGIKVNGLNGAMERSMKYVKKSQDQSGMFSYKTGTSGKASLTGMGVHCLQLGGMGSSVEAKRGLTWLKDNLPTQWKKLDLYGMRHASKASAGAMNSIGQILYWEKFRGLIPEIIIRNQLPAGLWPSANHFHGDSDLFRSILALDVLLTFYEKRSMQNPEK